MTKLEKTLDMAGMYDGTTVAAKLVPAESVRIDPEFAKIFRIGEKLLEVITEDMRAHGFDKAQPLARWRERGTLVDGHTRYKAALAAGIKEVPVEDKSFETEVDAKLYCYRRQAERRNLTGAEIYAVATSLRIDDARYGKSAAEVAEILGVGEGTIAHARAVESRGSEELKEAVRNNEVSIGKAYKEVRKKSGRVRRAEAAEREEEPEEREEEFPEENAGEGEEVSIADDDFGDGDELISLTEAVMLLDEKGEDTAVEILINHFVAGEGRRAALRKLLQGER
ncbi:MAG: ParB N-terminal domain-containing protein [Treponematales bacterium]